MVPLHRAALFIYSALFFLAYRVSGDASALAYLSSVPVADFTSLLSPFLKLAVIGDLFVGIGVVAGSLVYSKFVMWVLLSVALRSTSLVSRINSIPMISGALTLAERMQAVELTKSSLEKPVKRIRAINRWGEFLGGCGFLAAILGLYNSRLDFLAGLLLVFISFSLLVCAVKVFLSDYFGLAMYVARLEGRSMPGLSDVG